MSKLNNTPFEAYPLLDDNGYAVCKLYENRYTMEKFIKSEYRRFKSGDITEYNFPYEIGALLLSTFNPGYRLIELSDTNFVMRIVYNITDYTSNVIGKLNTTGKLQLYNKLSGNNSVLSKQMMIWLFACTIDGNLRKAMIETCMKAVENEVLMTYNHSNIPEPCSNVLKGWEAYMANPRRTTYTVMPDSIKALETLKIINDNFVSNLKYTPELSKYTIEVYDAYSEDYKSIMDKVVKLHVTEATRDFISTLLLKLAYLICHGLSKEAVSIVFYYRDTDVSLLLTSNKEVQKFVASAPRGKIITHNKNVVSNIERCTCTNRKKSKNVVVSYELMDEAGNRKEIDAKTLKELMASGKIFCTNLVMCRNGVIRMISNTEGK